MIKMDKMDKMDSSVVVLARAASLITWTSKIDKPLPTEYAQPLGVYPPS